MNNHKKKYDYGKCHVCGERMKEVQVDHPFWNSPRGSKRRKELVIIEDIPTGVCPRCGEKILRADVGREIIALLAITRDCSESRTLTIPVFRYREKAA